MSTEKRKWMTDVALGSLSSWYVCWDMCRNFGNPEARRRALCCKVNGLVWHDRHLVRGEALFISTKDKH